MILVLEFYFWYIFFFILIIEGFGVGGGMGKGWVKVILEGGFVKKINKNKEINFLLFWVLLFYECK